MIPLKVLIVDDSPVFRKVLSLLLEENPRFEVTGRAQNGQEALDQMESLHPDAVVLDVEMPVLGGLETLKQLRSRFPGVEVIMFSSLTMAGAETTFQALELGAFDFVPKPETGSVAEGLASVRSYLLPKLTFLHTRKTLRGVSAGVANKPPLPERQATAVPLKTKPVRGASDRRSKVPPVKERRAVALGISTGGPRALAQMVPLLPADLKAGLLIVQHMPPVFTETLAKRLNEISPLEFREARDGDEVRPGLALIAPGGRHMTVTRNALSRGPVLVKLNDNPPVNNCRPSVDVLFDSVADIYGPDSVGVIMTGMGSDGVVSLRRMKEQGAFVIAQNEETCTVFGMPRKPVEEGLADEVLPLNDIAAAIARAVAGSRR